MSLTTWHTRNELLNEYPELAEELEEELKKMEEENAAKQKELAELQKRLEDQQSTEDGSVGSAETGSGAAFVSSGKTAPSTTTEQENKGEEEFDEDASIQQGDDLEEVVEEDGSHDGEEALNVTETVDEVVDETETVASEKADEQTLPIEGNTTDVTAKSTKTSEDFTMTHLAIETLRAFVEHAKDDVKRLVGLMIPVVQPLFNAGDVAWRQIKALFLKARDAYYAEPTDGEDDDGKEDADSKK